MRARAEAGELTVNCPVLSVESGQPACLAAPVWGPVEPGVGRQCGGRWQQFDELWKNLRRLVRA